MITTNYAGQMCPHCRAIYEEGKTFPEHVESCEKNPRNLKAEAKRAYDKNLVALTEVMVDKAKLQDRLNVLDEEIGRLIYCLARDRAVFRAGSGQ